MTTRGAGKSVRQFRVEKQGKGWVQSALTIDGEDRSGLEKAWKLALHYPALVNHWKMFKL